MEKITVKEIVEYGLNSIPETEMTSIKSKDLFYVYRVLEECVRFLHQPDHYKDQKSILDFLGTVDTNGAFDVLSSAIYKKLKIEIFPKEIIDMYNNDQFEHPQSKDFYKYND